MIAILLFSACGPAVEANSGQFTNLQGSPTVTALAAATQSAEPETQNNSFEPPFEVRLSAVSSGAKVLRGDIEIPVDQAQSASIQVGDGIELDKLEGQSDRGYGILDFSNDLEVELFSNTSVFLNSLKQIAGGSTDVILDLDRGHLFLHPNEQTESRVTVQTIHATIKTLTAGAEFDVCQNDELTCVLVTKGVIEISAEGKKNIIKAGEAGFVIKNEPPSPPICAPLPAFIAWEDRFRLFADTPALDIELSQLKQSPCPLTSSGLPFDARIIYRDEFRHPSSGWERGVIDSFMVRYVRLTGRRYYEVQIQRPNDQFLAFVPNGRQYTDVNVDLRVIANAAGSGDFRYGTVFRRSGNQYYAFILSPKNQTWHFLKSSSTGLEVLKEGIDARMRDLESRNVLRVEAYGSTFLLFINGRFIDWVSDSEYASGEAGLFVESIDNPDAVIQFDSIVIWDVPPLLQNPNQGSENCFNTIDDDGDGLIDRADPACQRLDANITSMPPRTSIPGTTPRPAPTNTTRPPTDPPLNTPIPSIPAPLPTIVAPLPTIIAPLPTLIAPLPTILAPLPTLLPPLPTIQLPLPTIQLPLPTIQLPLPLRDEPSTPTVEQE